MTIGDVLAMIAVFVATAAAWGAMILLTGLLFPTRSSSAELCLTVRPWACFFRGTGVVAVLVMIAMVTLNAGQGPFRLLAGVAVGYGGLLSAIGSAAVVRLVASRLTVYINPVPGSDLVPETNTISFTLLLRATALYILSGLLPIVGWLFVTPIFLLLSVGAGAGAFMGSKKTVLSPTPMPTMEMGL
jgi:hypothetical protein